MHIKIKLLLLAMLLFPACMVREYYYIIPVEKQIRNDTDKKINEFWKKVLEDEMKRYKEEREKKLNDSLKEK